MNLKRLVIIFAGLILVLILFIVFKSPQSLKNIISDSEISITSQNGDKITVSRFGKATLISNEQNFSENWNSDKIAALKNYLSQHYSSSNFVEEGSPGSVTFYQNGGKVTVSVNGELTDEISKDIKEGDDYGGGGGGGAGGDDISGYFTSPTPASSSQPPRTPTPAPTGGAGGDPECIYWRLSYCVIKRTPIPTPTPIPGQTTIEIPPTCTDPLNRITGRTVIGNELCLPEE